MRIQFIKLISIILITLLFIYFSTIQVKENFITWFIPFYNKGTRELTDNTPKYITSNLEYNYLEYDYLQQVRFYVLEKTSQAITNAYYKFLFSNMVKSLKTKKFFVNYNPSNEFLLKKVNEDKNNFAIVSAPMLVDKMSNDLENVQNVNIVIVSNYRFIFFIINKQSQISKLLEMNGKRINVGEKGTDDYLYGQDIVNNLKINNDLEIKPSYLKEDESFKKLKNGEIDGMFFTDLYPSETLDKYILEDLERNLILIPLDDLNKEVFRQRNIFVEPVSIDQNALPDNYLPVKVKELKYTIFKPNLNTYRYPDFIVCNKSTEPRVSFGIVNSVVSNLNILNSSQFYIKNGYNYLAFPAIANSMYLPIHIGAKIFYSKITVNTVEPNDICKYYVGNSKCDAEKIEGAKIVMGLEDLEFD